MNATTGVMSGTLIAASAGTHLVTVAVSDGLLSESQSFRWSVGMFTDDPLIPGVQVMRAVHITELRARIDALRGTYRIAPAVWTDAPLVVGDDD